MQGVLLPIAGQGMLLQVEVHLLPITEVLLQESTGLLLQLEIITPHRPRQGVHLLLTALRAEAQEAVAVGHPGHQEEVQEEGINSLFFFTFLYSFPLNNNA